KAFTQKVRVNASRLGVTSLGGSQADFSCRGLVYKTMPKMANPREDDDLIPLMLNTSADDLGVLVGYITDNGAGRISLDNVVMSKLVAAQARAQFTENERLLIAYEIQLFGGNKLVNIFRRGKGGTYRQIVVDVADHLKVAYREDDPVAVIENGILVTTTARVWETMSDAETQEMAASMGCKVLAADRLR
ncbi:hypothetical protein ACQUJT_24415, partial [Ralstonia pseudosolanacearum]